MSKMSSDVSLIPKIFPVSDLQRRYSEILAWVREDRKPVLLVNKSFPEAVIIDIETYNALVRDSYEYDVQYVLQVDRKAMNAHLNGKSKKLRSLRDLEKK
jgi:prevent-host-death family protein